MTGTKETTDEMLSRIGKMIQEWDRGSEYYVTIRKCGAECSLQSDEWGYSSTSTPLRMLTIAKKIIEDAIIDDKYGDHGRSMSE